MPDQGPPWAVQGDLKLYYEDMGDLDDPPVLLIMGLGAQLLLWRHRILREARRPGPAGHPLRQPRRRPVQQGRTSRAPTGRWPRGWSAFWLGLRSEAAYTLEDMADDAAALLDHLGIDTRPHRRGIDGRHDRPGLRGAIRRTDEVSGGHLLQQQPTVPAAAGAPRLADAHQRPAAGLAAGGDRRQRRAGHPNHRQPRATRRPRSRSAPTPPRATTAATTHRASPGTSARCWPAAACSPTTGGPSHRPW